MVIATDEKHIRIESRVLQFRRVASFEESAKWLWLKDWSYFLRKEIIEVYECLEYSQSRYKFIKNNREGNIP